MNLLELIQNHPSFQNLDFTKRAIYENFADIFDVENSYGLALYLSPKELQEKFKTGTIRQWQDFLNLEPVQHYIKHQIQQDITVGQRKSIQALSNSAASGNVQAAKQIEELSGILNTDQNRTVVLHQINRPKHTTLTPESQ